MTKLQKIATAAVLGIVLGLIFSAGFIFGHKRGYPEGYSAAIASIKRDTVWRDTTVFVDRPVPVEVKPAGKEMYPVGTVAQLKRVIDSLAAVRPDTAFVEIPVPIETRLYRDEKDSTYVAQVSGFHPSLDWIEVRQKTAYIDIPIPTPVWPELLISPSALVSFDPGGLMLGGGVSADCWANRWQFSVDIGYGLHTGNGASTPGWYGHIRAKYNIIRK